MDKKYVLALDCGSTGIRALLFNKKGEIVHRAYEKVDALYPKAGWIENEPFHLVEKAKEVLKAISTKVNPEEIDSLGISNQRGSFCLWNKETGQPVINFINWADVRAADVAEKANKNFKWKILQGLAKIIALTGNPMMTATKMMKFTTDHASIRLKWVLENMPEVRQACESGTVTFGTIESWLIYNLTKEKRMVMDASNASSTGLFDPFGLVWNTTLAGLFNIPVGIFPEVVDNSTLFGELDEKIMGVSIPICGAAGDQQAALFGQGCFNPGDVKISQGSGAFVDMNVGNEPKLSKRGLFPLLAWRINNKPTFMIEGFQATAGTLIDWLKRGLGLSEHPTELNELANSVEDTDGVVFVPAPNGLRYPHFDPKARLTVVGVSLTTQRAHVARAVLEGIAFRLNEIVLGMAKDTKVPINTLRVDGGVSKSDLLLQCISNFSNVRVERAAELDMTGTGAAFLAGLHTGFWKFEELKDLRQVAGVYEPKMDEETRKHKIEMWNAAVQKALNWRY